VRGGRSGKTTLSQALEARGFTRLSIDEEVWRRSGRYDIDYPAADYRSHLDAGHVHLLDRLTELMARRVPTVVDSAFWNRAARDRYRARIEQAGCRCQLVYLRTPIELVRARLRERSRRFDANAAFPISLATKCTCAARTNRPGSVASSPLETRMRWC
jgi:predicted kinase